MNTHPQVVQGHTLLTEYDIYLFQTGKHCRIYQKLGSHLIVKNNISGVYFAVYAPAAQTVQVVGDFNNWNGASHHLHLRLDKSGIWEGFIPHLKKGTLYKFRIITHQGKVLDKIDPYARFFEKPPANASIVWQSEGFAWNDTDWLKNRKKNNSLSKPFSVYEVHLASWRRKNGKEMLNYGELSRDLVQYVVEMGFTHVELMPITEFPYDPSWGYQVTGYFAPTSRFGVPEGFKQLVNAFHEQNIGVIVDWVPSHFPSDAHALANYDGSHLYEHPDPSKGYQPDWDSYIFNYGKGEIASFLLSSAIFWLDEYHVDGLRVDAVASMLHLDFSRQEWQWQRNKLGGNEHLEAIEFIKELNIAVYREFPDAQTIAEESTTFPRVSHPTYSGGLGFGMKWMMGWMHDTLKYFKCDPLFRKHEHGVITFSSTYAFSENFMLALSHDEVVHGKSSMIGKMHGDEWQRFANLRTLYAYMFTHPGSKLLFMGNEFGQYAEWNFAGSLDWHLLQYAPHKGMQMLVKDLNNLYKTEPALHEFSFIAEGFEWLNANDYEHSVIAYMRKGYREKDNLIVLCNFTPVERKNYRVPVPKSKQWKELFNSDSEKYWGGGVCNKQPIQVEAISFNRRPFSISVTLPPLGVVILKQQTPTKKRVK